MPALMVFEKITQPDSADHFLSRGATVDPSPAFQSRGSGCIVVSVAAATVDIDRQNQPSLPRLGTDALIVPALKSRAKLTWSLPRPGKRWLRYFFKGHQSRGKWLHSRLSRGSDGWVFRSDSTVAAATESDVRSLSRLWKAGLGSRGRSATGETDAALIFQAI